MGTIYSGMKVFYFKEKIDSLPSRVSKILPPVHIRIKPTNVCNHRCSYCAYRAEGLQLGQDMEAKDFIPEKKMMDIIDDISEMGVKAVTFTGGGDPFCYPFLLATVKKLSKTPVRFSALTNGARLTGEVAQLFAHHATWLRISMDGWDDASYIDYRGVKDGEFTRILSNIKEFAGYRGKCYLGVSIIVDRTNAPHIFELAQKLGGIGVNSIKIAPCVVSNSGEENNNYHRSIFKQVKEQISKIIEVFKGRGVEVFDAYHTQLDSFKKEYTWCPYMQILPVIGADLNVYPCQDKAYNLKDGLVGSIKSQRFRDFWFSDKNKFFKINPSKVCNHHCVANNKNKMILEYLNADKNHIVFV